MIYSLSPEADRELTDAVAAYAAQVSVAIARDFLDTFEKKALLVAAFPGIGTVTTRGRRLFPIGRYSYSMLYRVEGGVVRISAIAHHSRRPGYWQGRK